MSEGSLSNFETLKLRREGAVFIRGNDAPPMNLMGPELVRDLVFLIQQAQADEAAQVLVFSSLDPGYFISHVDVTRVKENREAAKKLNGEASLGLLFDSELFLQGTQTAEFQAGTSAAMKHGFQTREGELNLAGMLTILRGDTN